MSPVPERWRVLFQELNGRLPDGEPGVRDVDAPCDGFRPYGAPWEHTREYGSCGTDGHYLCLECVQIDVRVYRARRDMCEDCGEPLIRGGPFGPEQVCSARCDRPAQATAAV